MCSKKTLFHHHCAIARKWVNNLRLWWSPLHQAGIVEGLWRRSLSGESKNNKNVQIFNVFYQFLIKFQNSCFTVKFRGRKMSDLTWDCFDIKVKTLLGDQNWEKRMKFSTSAGNVDSQCLNCSLKYLKFLGMFFNTTYRYFFSERRIMCLTKILHICRLVRIRSSLTFRT